MSPTRWAESHFISPQGDLEILINCEIVQTHFEANRCWFVYVQSATVLVADCTTTQTTLSPFHMDVQRKAGDPVGDDEMCRFGYCAMS